MTKPLFRTLLILSASSCYEPEVDIEDGPALCNWIQENDPVDCTVEECITVHCNGDNDDIADGECEPVILASEEGVDNVHDLSHWGRGGLMGVRCYSQFINGDGCADRFVNCIEGRDF